MIPGILGGLEVGMWSGWLGSKFGSKERTRSILIDGTNTLRSISILDDILERETKHATTTQRKTAAVLAKVVCFLANSRACELLIRKILVDKAKTPDKQIVVKLHV